LIADTTKRITFDTDKTRDKPQKTTTMSTTKNTTATELTKAAGIPDEEDPKILVPDRTHFRPEQARSHAPRKTTTMRAPTKISTFKFPSDYDQLLTLDDILKWNCYRLIKRIIEIKGYYSCMLDSKKTVIIK